MSMVPFNTQPNDGGNNFFPNWIDRNTIKNIQCTISNFFIEKMGLANPYIAIINFPLRAWNCAHACRDKSYWKVTLDIIAFSSIFFSPYGAKAAIAIDLTSELINICTKNYHQNYPYQYTEETARLSAQFNRQLNAILNKPKLDCTIHENAILVLGLTEETAQDRSNVDERYEYLLKEWSDRLEKTRGSPLSKRFEILKIQVEEAYQTLIKEEQQRRNNQALPNDFI